MMLIHGNKIIGMLKLEWRNSPEIARRKSPDISRLVCDIYVSSIFNECQKGTRIDGQIVGMK